ncbi:AfsR/SARP family transcriptional regulator [Kitasatospora brasiliensis]|uniref:AfsR/SARP family transcriptional regulator n=1 Tax=Kitasatospora brasiliensis TaxID=3058040 RepID=UPI00292F1354|nr:BTAD domain-containing putative transcriptional regulator [Kitasatospora sp. K002]
MTTIRIGILGPLRVEFGSTEAALSGARLRSILSILAIRADGEVQRDELIEELNLSQTTDNATNALHAHVARIRRWLERHGGRPDLLETVNSGYRLNVDQDAVDARQFVALVERAVNLAPATPSVVATILEDALPLWRGSALPDALDGPLGAAAADELHHWRAIARQTLIDAWLSLDHNRKVVLNARRFIAEDPLNEVVRARYITALRRMGRHAEAIEVYKDAERVLGEELGIGPGAELHAAAIESSGPGTRPRPAPVSQRREHRSLGESGRREPSFVGSAGRAVPLR